MKGSLVNHLSYVQNGYSFSIFYWMLERSDQALRLIVKHAAVVGSMEYCLYVILRQIQLYTGGIPSGRRLPAKRHRRRHGDR